MDRFCVTKAGDPLPILGQAIKEDDEFLKQRKKGMKILWSTEHVYTLGLWSAYVDWVDWQIQGFPGTKLYCFDIFLTSPILTQFIPNIFFYTLTKRDKTFFNNKLCWCTTYHAKYLHSVF